MFLLSGCSRFIAGVWCRLITFSPLVDKELPECDGIILGGGYPELYAKELAENLSMRTSIKTALKIGKPCFAECGGFMYLLERFQAASGEIYEWTGAISGETFMTGQSLTALDI